MAEDYPELNKQEIMFLYKQKCEQCDPPKEPHPAFMNYLERTIDDVETIVLEVRGNDKRNFNNRLDDQAVILLAAALEPFAFYIVDIDLRFNEITDDGALALAELISKSP